MYQPNMAPVDMNNNNNNGDDDDNNENNNNFNGGNEFRDEEIDSGNTSENQDGVGSDDQDIRPAKKKRYHRHTQQQIHEMELFFKECPHPDDKQRKELSRQIGLDHLQIKFWFQNKRTQNKNQLERHENSQLRTENERLKLERRRYQEAIARALCPKCGGPTAIGDLSFEEHHLRIENAKLAEEIAELTSVMERCIRKPIMNYPLPPTQLPPPQNYEFGMGNTEREVHGNGGGNLSMPFFDIAEADKPLIIELAVNAMNELMIMAQIGEPLWMGGVNGTSVALNLDEYARTFQNGLGPSLNGLRTEASRETAIVAMNHMGIVNLLMDQTQWSTMFAGMIAKTVTVDVINTGAARSVNGSFHLITAEFQVLSPLVATRDSYFVRYCKQQGNGFWAVVDVSIDQFVPSLELTCRRRPSGCLIQEIPNGFSKVTWVEHVEVDDRGGVHNMYKQLISTGQALGANRWLATLDRQCERLTSIMAINSQPVDSDGLIRIPNEGQKQILKLAERMARGFFTGATSSIDNMWHLLPGGGGDGIRVTMSKSLNDPGKPTGVVLCAATSFWVPLHPKNVFDFIRDEDNRDKWDILSLGGTVHKIAQIANGRDSRNCVSLLRTANGNHKEMMMVQETSTDPTASFVIYAPVAVGAMDSVIGGADADYVALLPSGFAILPDGSIGEEGGEGEGGGSLVTVSIQMLVDPAPSGRLTVSSVATAENLIRVTVDRIKGLSPCYNAPLATQFGT
ncbi:unnamed protein product [Cochlearia groenlandica]